MATESLGKKVCRMEAENRRFRAARKRVLRAYQRLLDHDDLDGMRDALTDLEAATEETENPHG